MSVGQPLVAAALLHPWAWLSNLVLATKFVNTDFEAGDSGKMLGEAPVMFSWW